MKKIVCFGEVLWDVLPTKKIAGGAPMNVAIRLQSLGIDTQIISRIGSDALGMELLDFLKEAKVDSSLVQVDEYLGTSEVLVTLDSQGSASYEIVYPCGWDSIQATPENIAAVEQADALVFGSLSCRDEVSRTTLLSLLPKAKYKVFDVNIRPPFYSIALLKELMELSDCIKLNDDELLEVAKALGSSSENIETNILFLSQLTTTESICVTKGKDGAILYTANQFYSSNGFEVAVADTIGAGDSFLAAFLSSFLYTTEYDKAITLGCAVGALVASHSGANPVITTAMVEELIGKSEQ